MSYHPVASRQPSRARGMVSPNPLRSLRSLLMRKPPFIVEMNVVPPCFAPPRGVLGEALLLRSLTLRIGVACATPLFVEIMSYHPVALRQPLCKWGVMIYSASFRPLTLFQRPRVKSGIFTGLLPFAMEAAVSSPRQDHSAAS